MWLHREISQSDAVHARQPSIPCQKTSRESLLTASCFSLFVDSQICVRKHLFMGPVSCTIAGGERLVKVFEVFECDLVKRHQGLALAHPRNCLRVAKS